jgi:hypothetical protein
LLPAPEPHELYRFPPRPHVRQVLTFQRELRRNVEARQGVQCWRYWYYQEALDELAASYLAWDTLDDAWAMEAHPQCCAAHLARLRDLLGPEAWYTGRMPPVFPEWIMQPMD